jgi:rare lipoprotein A
MRRSSWAVACFTALVVAGCATQGGREAISPDRRVEDRKEDARWRDLAVGFASYYARSLEGMRTASGERHRADEMTAAHRTLPFGTRVRVTNLANDRHVIVVVNDRGPHVKGRIIDLSRRAARQLGFLERGLAKVRLEIRP